MSSRQTTRSARRYAVRSKWLLPLFAVILVASTALVTPAVSSASTTGGFGPLPSGLPIESRCMDMTVAAHIVFVGDDVEGQTHGGICGSAPADIGWTWAVPPGAPGVSGCGHDDTHCKFKVTKSTDQQLVSLCIDGNNVQGGWTSCDYYGVVGDTQGVLDGYVKDKDGGPVSGVTVKAYGHPGATATSDAAGFYAMTVEKGTYQVEPEGGPTGKSAPSYTPKVASATVKGGKTTEANFTLDTGEELKLTIDKTSVAASGDEVVSGNISVTEHGKPVSNTMVQLEVKPSEKSGENDTTGALAAICSSGGTAIWPTGFINTPDGYPVTVTTNATGQYPFTLTVGTTPGVWTLDAWAYNDGGTLSSDASNASETKSITFTNDGTSTLGGFVTELDTAAKSTSFSTTLSSTAGSAIGMVTLLSQVSKSTAGGVNFQGLGYAMANGQDGQIMIIFPVAQPPVVNSEGVIESALSRNADDLVYAPQEWTGAGMPSAVANVTSLASVVAAGQLTRLPTLAQFDAGAAVPGWKTIAGNKVTQFSQDFEYLGWGYPSSTAGSCY
jgi:hypothetical protein